MSIALQKVTTMGCPCYAVSEATLEQQLLHFVEQNIAGYSVAINAEKIHKYNTSTSLRQVIDDSVYPYPDGAGAVLALKWLHGLSAEKINMPIRVLEIANKYKLSVFVVGAKAETHQQAVNIIRERYTDINIVGTLHGYHSEAEIVTAVQATKPQLIMIAMGSPKQELFAHKLIQQTGFGFAVGCGGALDIIAGKLKRAPEFFIHNNLEWLYRLVQEPWRWKRQLFLPIFFIKLIGLKLRHHLFNK